MKIGIISGYFNPIHAGHIQYINSAKQNCNFLIAIINNDNQVLLKKSKKFMDEAHRLKIVSSIKNIDLAILSCDQDSSVSKTLQTVAELFGGQHELYFYNSGDRKPQNSNELENSICQKCKIQNIFLNLPKIYSSSEIKNAI